MSFTGLRAMKPGIGKGTFGDGPLSGVGLTLHRSLMRGFIAYALCLFAFISVC